MRLAPTNLPLVFRGLIYTDVYRSSIFTTEFVPQPDRPPPSPSPSPSRPTPTAPLDHRPCSSCNSRNVRKVPVLELAILGLLEDQQMHGYEIRRRLRDELGVFSNVSFGSLYPALSRLERSGAVEAAEDPEATHRMSVPMTGSLSGERAALRSLRSRHRPRPPCPACLPDHGSRANSVRRPVESRGLRRRRGEELQPPAGIRPLPAPPGTDAAARTPACPARRAALGFACGGRRGIAPRSVCPVPRGAHDGIDRTRDLLARASDRRRAFERPVSGSTESSNPQ